MLGNVFKAYDIRGTTPTPLTEDVAWRIGYGASAFLIGEAERAGQTTPMMRHVVVGRDMRKTSPTLSGRLIDGITSQGGGVIDVGLVDTPFIYFAVNYLDCAGGIQTTASHNPPKYNGFKISARKAAPVGEVSGLAEVRKLAATVDKNKAPEPDPTRVEKRDLWDPYVSHVRSFLDLGGRKLKVVVDASNGMAGAMCPRVFGKKGADIDGLTLIEMNFDISTGEFVHEPNPLLPSAIAELRERVKEEEADLGVCYDGDADRCIVIDEKGNPVSCDLLTAWLAGWFLEKNPGAPIIYDLRSSKAVEEEVRAKGGKPVRSRVGHVFLKQLMKEHGGVFGGELSGHFYFRDNFNADSGAIAMATVLTALAQADKPLSELIKPLDRYPRSGETNFEIEEKDEAIEELTEAFGDDAEIDSLDGVTIDAFDNKGWWCNIRKSNTEPLLRLNLEAKDQATLTRVFEQMRELLGEPSGH